LDAAREPVTRCLRLEILALAALAAQDPGEPACFREALDAASALGFAACEARLQACAALRSLDAGRRCVAARPARSGTPRNLIAVSTLVFPEPLQTELRRLAPSRVTVLLVGGSSRLKAEAARALHELSPRVGAPFVTFDCTARGSEAVELLLFGGPAHEHPRGGSIHAAETGTLYVSAIDELPLLMQPRFLRFLDQEKRVRVVASAGADLDERVRQGHLRPDLGERLTLVQLLLPELEKSV
jgi:DNA-binding NtrC family response regulator